jgi:hypothetical protein
MSNVMDTIGDQCKAFYFGWLTDMHDDEVDIRKCHIYMVDEFDLTFTQAIQITAAWIEQKEQDEKDRVAFIAQDDVTEIPNGKRTIIKTGNEAKK